jgi:hypothetical protein
MHARTRRVRVGFTVLCTALLANVFSVLAATGSYRPNGPQDCR